MADYSASTRTASPSSGVHSFDVSCDGSTRTFSNLATWYRMRGFDTLSAAWVSWVVSGRPDPTAAHYPGGGVSVSGAWVLDRWQA